MSVAVLGYNGLCETQIVQMLGLLQWKSVQYKMKVTSKAYMFVGCDNMFYQFVHNRIDGHHGGKQCIYCDQSSDFN